MPANIQVVLQQDVNKLGKSGELVRVRKQYAMREKDLPGPPGWRLLPRDRE